MRWLYKKSVVEPVSVGLDRCMFVKSSAMGVAWMASRCNGLYNMYSFVRSLQISSITWTSGGDMED